MSEFDSAQGGHEPYRFKFPESRQGLPFCHIRVLEDGDLAACTEIYKLNEPGRFPPNHLEECLASLQCPTMLSLVCESDGVVCGFGSIASYSFPTGIVNTLSFGMIRPDRHRQGFGTTLLFARMAALNPPVPQVLSLNPVPTSRSFFKRFGFLPSPSIVDETGQEVEQLFCHIYPDDVYACAQILHEAGIETPDLEVPLEFPAPPLQ